MPATRHPGAGHEAAADRGDQEEVEECPRTVHPVRGRRARIKHPARLFWIFVAAVCGRGLGSTCIVALFV